MTTGVEAAADPPELLADVADSLYGKMLDIEMLALTPYGQEHTEAEFQAQPGRAGPRLGRIVRTASPLSVLEAWPA